MKELQPHQNGSFITDTGSIYNRYSKCIIEEPAVLMDTDTMTMLKVGNAEYVKQYLNKACTAYKNMGNDITHLQIIVFDKYKNLSIDQICTMINYLSNHLEPKQVQELLSLSESKLIDKLNRLYEIGF